MVRPAFRSRAAADNQGSNEFMLDGIPNASPDGPSYAKGLAGLVLVGERVTQKLGSPSNSMDYGVSLWRWCRLQTPIATCLTGLTFALVHSVFI